jgi:A/G-specific adenine glycosylase
MRKNEIARLRKSLLDWYRANRRDLPWRKNKGIYPIWVSEVMLQQTQVNTVLPYYDKFMRAFPDVTTLARADLEAVLKIWEGMGYYARARNLHRAAQTVRDRFDGGIPTEWQAFRSLPGVGDYIAAAVLSIACQQPHAVVDGNVKRVLSRLFRLAAPVNSSSSSAQFQAAAADLLDVGNPGTFNQALMELGALVCVPRSPACQACPARGHCRAWLTETVADYPKRLKKKPLPHHHIAVGVVVRNTRVLITRRKPEGLLGGLWEFPGGRLENGEDPETACVREIKEEVNLNVRVDRFLTRVRHAYTHFKIDMDVYLCRYLSGRVRLRGPSDHRWVRLTELDRFPFPRANHKFIPLLREQLKDL